MFVPSVTNSCFLFVLSHFFVRCYAKILLCYQCGVGESIAESCDYFDGTYRFLVECGLNHICSKIVRTFPSDNGETVSKTTRGCALQTSSTAWEHPLECHVTEGAVFSSTSKAMPKTLEICYCKTTRCNDAQRFRTVWYWLLLLAILWCIM